MVYDYRMRLNVLTADGTEMEMGALCDVAAINFDSKVVYGLRMLLSSQFSSLA